MEAALHTPTEEPIAIIHGQAFTALPKDLYIPPDAMKVLLEAFEGPFDLLLYLIKKQNIDILDIPVAEVTRQYMEYVDIMREFSIELAAEYLVMAAILAEIKSRMLLPRPVEEGSEDDPRTELVRRLQEYERYKQAAEAIETLPRQDRDFFLAHTDMCKLELERPQPQVSLKDILTAFMDVVRRAELLTKHQIRLDALSVRDRMSHILSVLQDADNVAFSSLFKLEEGRHGIVVTFLAMLELLKDHLIEFIQAQPFAPIYLRPGTNHATQAEVAAAELSFR